MRQYSIDARNIKNPIYPCPIQMGGKNANGQMLSIGNYYLSLDGKPFFGICGEAHFSRINRELWEDEIIKMKAGGLNMIATYIFWIHHEEIEGTFDFSGNKDLRLFLELCKKNHMYVILRIGPFSHGECRNGGFPDWIYGQPFDIRCDDPSYLYYTRRFYEQIYQQAKGLLFKDNGPVIGVQLENEHEHASCPWEMTTENSKEWVVSGHDGKNHMSTLKKIAKEVGFDVPLYTDTAWGGACAPEDTVFPLWGGYAFRPWMFYDGKLKEHPATAEYLYGDFHNNSAPKYYNFDPEYAPEDFPYACCEMGGGMNVYYPYRFQLPYESVAALSQVKSGSGCNFLGYYMYHGGTHPKGKTVPYMNECDVPKFSYDYQAPLGEFGQVRLSYHQLKLQHLFYQEFTSEITAAKTVLSKEAEVQTPEDVETLRYVVRADEQGHGFLYLNNYQDHVETIDQTDFCVTIQSDLGEVRFPQNGSLNLAKDACAILPYWFSLEGHLLKYATAQLITKAVSSHATYYFFSKIRGMSGEFVFPEDEIIPVSGCSVQKHKVILSNSETSVFTFGQGNRCIVTVLNVNDAERLWQYDTPEGRKLFLCDCPVLYKDNEFELEYPMGEEVALSVFPSEKESIVIHNRELSRSGNIGPFITYTAFQDKKEYHFSVRDASSVNSDEESTLKRPVVGSPITSSKVVNARAVLQFEPDVFTGMKQVMLRIRYRGDIGYAFSNGEMFHDNFCNGAPWEIDLLPYKEKLLDKGMYIYVSPKKSGGFIDSSSAMAAMVEVFKDQVAHIDSIELQGIKSLPVSL